MQKIHAIVAISIVATLGCTTVTAANLPGRPSRCASCNDQSQVMAGESEGYGASDYGSACGGCGSLRGTHGGWGLSCGICGPLSRIRGGLGSLCGSCGGRGCGILGHKTGCNSGGGSSDSSNCSCRGSYKFPVPPLYTYHWPGMYSQNFMTEYISPYRFPPLEIPEFIPRENSPAAPNPGIHNTSVSPARLGSLPPQGSYQPLPPQGSYQPLPPQLSAQPLPPQGSYQPLPPQLSAQPLPPQGSYQPLPPQGSYQPLLPQLSAQPLPPQGSYQPLPPPLSSRPKPMSVRIKEKYGIK